MSHAQTVNDGVWHGGIALGGTLASGNADSQTISVLGDVTKATKDAKLSANSVINYGSTEKDNVTTRTARLLRFGGRYDFNLTNEIFSFAGGTLETNKVQNITSRFAVNTGAGLKAIRTPDTTWDFFAGLGYSGVNFERTTPPESPSITGGELYLGQESANKLSATANFKQRLAIYLGQAELGSRSTFDASLSTAVAAGWTLNVGLSLSYTSKASLGFQKKNSLLTFGFGTKF